MLSLNLTNLSTNVFSVFLLVCGNCVANGSNSDAGPRSEDAAVYAKTSTGVLRGYVSYVAGRDRPVNAFKGIPFAEPPVGRLRFAKPKKKAEWKGQWDATKYSLACPSNTSRTTSPQHNIDEDCLYANVFTSPKCTKTNLCPVLFYVHGGAFTFGSAVMFNDTEIIRRYASDDVVFVLPAYRLGVFGFLDLGSDEVVPRNLGLHDIILSLEWARNELEAFGGDKDRVTLWGNSAGGTAIWLLGVSPAVPADLFQQLFVSSGEPYFAENVNDVATRGVLEQVGCLFDRFNKNRTVSNEDKLSCLRRLPALELLEAQSILDEVDDITFSGPESDTELLPAKSFAQLVQNWKPRNSVFTVMLDEFTNRRQNITKECATKAEVFGYSSKAVLDMCILKYNGTIDDDYMQIRIDAYRAEAFLQAYVNTDKGADSFLATFNLENHTLHANDLTFLIGLHPVKGREMSPEEMLMDRYYPEMVKRFIRTGRPEKGTEMVETIRAFSNSEWKPIGKDGRGYFVLDFQATNESLEERPHYIAKYFDSEALKFWLWDLAKTDSLSRWLPALGGLRLFSEPSSGWTLDEWLPSEGSELSSAVWHEIALTVVVFALIVMWLVYRFKDAGSHSGSVERDEELAKIVDSEGIGLRYT